LNYGAEIIGDCEGKDIERIHCKFLRKILCVKKNTNLDGLYGETGRYPMRIQRMLIMFKYWTKILNLPDNTLLKSIYNLLKEDANANNTYNNSNWAYTIKKHLNELGLNYMWQYQNNTDINLQLIKTRILDQFKQSWYAKINNSSKLSSYNMYKHGFEIENYLHFISNDQFRIVLTKFRLSSHDLAIETGRYENKPREERLCTYCRLRVIEDEYHFLLVCPNYYELRRLFLKPYYCRWPTIQKFETIMSSKIKKDVLNLSKYLYYAFKQRNTQLN
jgi:hypothetical protein